MQHLYGPGRDVGGVSERDVVESYPWPDGRAWVRAMMVTTLDGAAVGPDGLSGTISSEADKQVFDAVRREADAVLVGAETIRAEQYAPMTAKSADAERRQSAGQLPAPVVVVVSASLALPWALPIWSQSTHTPLVLTSEDADEQRLSVAREHADVVTLSETTPRLIVDALVERGLRRIVCEGGPRLLHDLIGADLVDEVDITIAPLLAGTGETPRTPMLDHPARYRLAHVLEGDGYLMTRYISENR